MNLEKYFALLYRGCIFFEIHISERACPKTLKFFVQASHIKIFVCIKFQLEIRKNDFAEKVGSNRESSLKKSISLSRYAISSSYFKFVSFSKSVIICTRHDRLICSSVQTVPLLVNHDAFRPCYE
jgi:hypothetical protein